jgi:peptidoglycan/xylan/chitin deacetylase (PgdA/CDA1 family)
MHVTTLIKKSVTYADALLATATLSRCRERAGLISLMFHSVFQNKEEANAGFVHPQQGTTVQSLRECLDYFLNCGYRFVSPEDILSGLDPTARHVLLTFDDGYYNNLRALPLLREFDIPASFFISSGHVRTGKGFWWDIAYRNSAKMGASFEQLSALCAQKRTSEIEEMLKKRLGSCGLDPIGDIDRPLHEDELARLAQDPHVHIGNHTDDHAVLTNYTEAEAAEQIAICQAELKRITGKLPKALAYPQGVFNERIVAIAREQELTLAITCIPGKTRLPISSNAMLLHRYILWENDNQESQYRRFRSDVAIYPFLFQLTSRFRN